MGQSIVSSKNIYTVVIVLTYSGDGDLNERNHLSAEVLRIGSEKSVSSRTPSGLYLAAGGKGESRKVFVKRMTRYPATVQRTG